MGHKKDKAAKKADKKLELKAAKKAAKIENKKAGKPRHLCSLAKDGFPASHPSEYLKLVLPPAYYCEKCGRVAAEKASLCHPKKIG